MLKKNLQRFSEVTMKIIRVNMSRGEITTETVNMTKPIAGRAIIDWYMTKRANARIHPLSEDNPFIVAPGFLSGSSAPSAGRLSIGGKSPLTGGIKEANVGGSAAHKLGRLSIEALIVEGKAPDWQILKIDGKGMSLEPAGDIVGLDNYDACEKLQKRFGSKVGILIIGVAGERLYANSTIAATDPEGRPCRHAARGGVGAIMGSKHLKAIILDDSGVPTRKAHDPKAFKEASKNFIESMRSIGPYGEVLKAHGTAFFVDVDNDRGSLQTHNYRSGSFDRVTSINAAKIHELNKKRGGTFGHACSTGCVVQCSNTFNGPDGKYLTASFEYETLTFLGANLGIDDLDTIARMDRKCDGIGIDTIETGATIGILNDIGLFNFGDGPKAESYLEEIAQGTVLGRVLGNGTDVTAKIFGISRVPTVKRQAIAAHSGRSMKGWGVTYATSPQGADHTAGPVGAGDFLNPHGQVAVSRNSQIINTAMDATGLCHFTFAYRFPHVIAPLINAYAGTELTDEDIFEMGRVMLRQERAFNLKAGIGPGEDGLPEWMKKEPLPPTNAVFDVPQEEIDDFFNF
jgi:aldehyde:ferredoxin oxidoreductase